MELNQSDFDELYQTIILDHSRKPRNYGPIDGATSHARGDNPSCGDEVEVFVKLSDRGMVENIQFIGQGCAISQASASLMTLRVKGHSKEEVSELIEAFQNMVLSTQEIEPPKMLGDLRLLKGVRKFPQRVKCATLAWQALKEALSSIEGKGATSNNHCS